METLAIDLWHGSSRVIKHPEYGLGKPNNDYGRGFYCTRSVELAKEWACAGLDDGFANRYTLATNGLTFLDLSQLPYTILNWLALLVENRRFQPTTTVAAQGIEYLKQVLACRMPVRLTSSSDIVPTIRISRSPALLSITRFPSTNSPRRCGWASSASRSYSRSPQAFAALRFQGCEIARASTYHGLRNERDRTAREAYRRKSAEADLDGLFMRDIIREKVTNDDPRL